MEVAKMEYDDWSPVVKQNWERYMAWTKEEEEEESKYLSEFPHAVKTNIADNHTLPFPKLLPNEEVAKMEIINLFPAKKQEEETKFISEEKPPPVTTKVAKMEYDDWSPVVKQNWERYLARKKEKEEERKYLSEFPPAAKTNIANNHTLPFPKLLPNEGLKVESFEEDPFGSVFNNEKMKKKLCCCPPSRRPLNLNSLLDARQRDEIAEVAKMEYVDWSPFMKENCERYLARKKEKEEERKYLSEFPPAVKTNIADNHTLPFPKLLPNEGLKVESFEEDPFATTNFFSKNKGMESKLVRTNPVCNPFPAKKEKESKFVMTKPLVAEKRPVVSDPFLAEKPPHMFLKKFFAYQQKVEKLAEMLKVESIEGEQVTTDPLVAKHHVSTMFLNLFLAYKQEVERVAKMLKKESIDGEPFLTTDPILAEKPLVLAHQQEVESSKKKQEESNTTNIAEKHNLTFDAKPVSQPASSSDTAT